VLKLPRLPSSSRAPWGLLGQLSSLGALLLAHDHPLQGRQVRLQPGSQECTHVPFGQQQQADQMHGSCSAGWPACRWQITAVLCDCSVLHAWMLCCGGHVTRS
jgi:hypothetical protein